jgi:hypothetical protein
MRGGVFVFYAQQAMRRKGPLLRFITMQIDAVLKNRLNELEAQAKALPFQVKEGYRICRNDAWQQWATSAQHLIRVIFGELSPHYLNFKKHYTSCHGFDDEINALKGIFRTAKADYEGGLVFSMQARISG